MKKEAMKSKGCGEGVWEGLKEGKGNEKYNCISISKIHARFARPWASSEHLHAVLNPS